MTKLSRAAAQVAGLPHYFTGQPCRYGHRAPRLTSNRHCTGCHCKRVPPRRRDPDLRIRRLRRLVRDRVYSAVRIGRGAGMLGCSIDQFRSHIESLFQPGMSWDNYGHWHLDHKRALASFDLTDRKQLAAAVHYSNYQPLWSRDNLRKGKK